MTTPTSQQTAARMFVEFWTGKGYEKGQTLPFTRLRFRRSHSVPTMRQPRLQ